jgi:Family of unknown function (DUF6325)
MNIGPVEYMVVKFPGNKFSGDIAPQLAALVGSGTIRILDLLFVIKDTDGTVDSFEFDQLDELAPFADIEGEVGGFTTPEDVEYAASFLEPGSSAALLIWEDLWAAPFADAVLSAGGELVESARIPHRLVELVFDELASAS